MEQLSLSVSGMTCTGCENRIERTLTRTSTASVTSTPTTRPGP